MHPNAWHPNQGNAAKRVADLSEGPWKAWTGLARYERAIRFIETYCRAPKGEGFGQPLVLAEFQKEFIEVALADDVDVAVLTTPRGNGKSSLGGALAVWALFDDDLTGQPQVPICATTVGQAIRSCYGVAVSMVKAERELFSRALIFTGASAPKVVVPSTDGEMFPIANVPDGLQGLDPSFALVDEIGFQETEAWNALRMASGKRPRSLVVGVGTPGLDHENALWDIRTAVFENENMEGVVFHEWAAPEGCALQDHDAWRIANPAIAAGFLREKALETDLSLAHTQETPFRVFRLGQWAEGIDCWLGDDGRAIWDGLASPWDFVEHGKTWVGVDVGLKHDSTAVVALQFRPDEEEHPVERVHAICRLWVPKVDEPVDTTDVMRFLRELDDRYDLEAVSYDPRFFDVPAKYLEDEGLPMVEIPQTLERMSPAVGSLYERILGGGLTHDGDEAFSTQVLAAKARFNDRGFILSKGKSHGRIDGAVALALANDRVTRPEPVVKAERPMILLGRRR